ncbi:MAG: hypothetical protein R6V85_05765 [Polyangia bacterium]
MRTIQLTREMIELADAGDRDRRDDDCGILYSVVRDAAYRIRELAEKECEAHKASAEWSED